MREGVCICNLCFGICVFVFEYLCICVWVFVHLCSSIWNRAEIHLVVAWVKEGEGGGKRGLGGAEL